jgi:hypothetical protein
MERHEEDRDDSNGLPKTRDGGHADFYQPWMEIWQYNLHLISFIETVGLLFTFMNADCYACAANFVLCRV